MRIKSLGLLVFCSAMAFALSACQPVGPVRQGLDFERSVFAKVDDAGAVTFLDKVEYERGEAVNFALMKVGKFKVGEDGKHRVESDLKVRQGRKVIFEKSGLLGEAGHVLLKDGEADSPSGVFTATASLEPGDYSMELTVYDKVGGGKVRDMGTFTVK